MDYYEAVNNPRFRTANRKVDEARKELRQMGMSEKDIYDWIKVWASGAGDGIE